MRKLQASHFFLMLTFIGVIFSVPMNAFSSISQEKENILPDSLSGTPFQALKPTFQSTAAAVAISEIPITGVSSTSSTADVTHLTQ